MQRSIITNNKKTYFGFGVLFTLIIALQPAFVFAAVDPSGIDPSTTTSTALSVQPPAPDTSSLSATPPANPTPPPPGTQKPTGAAANSFQFNPTTGLWENDYYTWDPATHLTQPKTPLVYTYNPTTGKWDMTQWIWNSPKSIYQAVTVSVATPPAGALTSGSPPVISPDKSNTTNPQNSDGSTTSLNNLGVNNQINANSLTGNATVTSNSLGGSALSGSAQTIANVMNLLGSTSSLVGSNVVTFSQTIGDHTGDIKISPDLLQPATSQQGLANGQINVATNGQINNNIALGATSGNATVANNTTAGNATSGSADAVANVVNVINSAIASSQSFLGVLNIDGNLNGNILVPAQLLNTLVASNVPTAILNTSQITNGKILDQFNNNQAINNQITTTAASGNANVTDNTTAGNATTGKASTNVTIFNLTGQQVVGSNSLLVFVNVLGKWVGLIMNAPAGSTAAELGGGISQNTQLPAANITSTSNETINNNIAVNANSGNSEVSHNTTAGNATTGDANASVNLLNITNSQLNFSNWFGILFINVFGTWTGNFGTYDTNANVTPPISSPLAAIPSSGTAPQTFQAFRFVPSANHGFHLVSFTAPSNAPQVLGAAMHTPHFTRTNKLNTQGVHNDHIILLPIITSLLCLLTLIGNEIHSTWKKTQTQKV